MEAKFYKCPICGNVFAVIEDSGVVPVCCGKPMLHLNAMQTDGAAEKHVHHICFVAVESCCGLKIIHLDPAKPAEAVYCDCGEKVKAVYEYCNLHGLWKSTEIPTRE